MESDGVKLIFNAPKVTNKEPFTMYAFHIPRVGEMVAIPNFWKGEVLTVEYVWSRFGGWEHVIIELKW